jgi:RsiW-degrading membrane proteinase PrsW (M82 family)
MSLKNSSVFNEPQFGRDHFAADDTDGVLASETLSSDEPLPVGHGAWDEPALSVDLAGERPSGIRTYAQWLADGVMSTSFVKSWGVTLGLALVSGLWAVIGAIISQLQGSGLGGLLLIVVIGPLSEEMMKASAVLMTIEKWPYLFRSPLQIVFCCIAAATGFAMIENMLYLHLYILHPTAVIIMWRRTVCVMLHVGCSLIVSMGLVKIWRETMSGGKVPRVSLGTPYFITAAVVHGCYNFAAVLANPVLSKF